MADCLQHRSWDAGGGAVVVAVSGEIDLTNAERLRTVLTGAANPGTRLVICDMSTVDFLACSGLSAILAAQSTLADQGVELHLVARNRAVLRPLVLTGLLTTVDVSSDLLSALRLRLAR